MSLRSHLTVAVDSATESATASRLLLALVCLCQFMVILDASIINVALPSLAHELGFGPANLGWVVNGYLLPFAGLMLVAGRTADLLGPRPLLVAGVVLFTLASLAGGLAGGPAVLVAARVVQGVGAAMMAPAAIAVVNTQVAPAARARALAAWAAAGGLGGTLGAVAGGLIIAGSSWRWVLLINVPMGVVLVGLALRTVERRPVRRGAVDVLGAVCSTVGLAALTYGVMRLPDHPWNEPTTLAALVGGTAALAGFVLVEVRVARQPMLPLHLFAARPVRIGNLAMVAIGGISIAMWYFTSLLFQDVLRYSPLQSGLAQTPAALAFMLTARWVGSRLADRDPRRLLVGGSLSLVAGFVLLAAAGPTPSYAIGLLGPTVLVGIGIGLALPSTMAIATSGVPHESAGVAGGVASTAQQAGAAVGLALLTVLAAVPSATEGPGSGGAGYGPVFLAAAGSAALIGLLALRLPAPLRR